MLRLIICFIILSVAGFCYGEDEFLLNNINEDIFAKSEMTVVTFNMLHGFWDTVDDISLSSRLKILAHTIANEKPDVLLLQEASVTEDWHGNVIITLADLVNKELAKIDVSYNYLYARANGSAKYIGFEEGSAVLSRYKIVSPKVCFFEHNATSLPETRIALYCEVSGKSGNIGVTSTHLTSKEDKIDGVLVRDLQARELIDKIIIKNNLQTLVVGGDFNDIPQSKTIEMMNKAGGMDLFFAKNPKKSGFTSLNGGYDLYNPDMKAESRIDYLFLYDKKAQLVKSQLFLNKAQEIDEGYGKEFLWASDHIGVLATFCPGEYTK